MLKFVLLIKTEPFKEPVVIIGQTIRQPTHEDILGLLTKHGIDYRLNEEGLGFKSVERFNFDNIEKFNYFKTWFNYEFHTKRA